MRDYLTFRRAVTFGRPPFRTLVGQLPLSLIVAALTWLLTSEDALTWLLIIVSANLLLWVGAWSMRATAYLRLFRTGAFASAQVVGRSAVNNTLRLDWHRPVTLYAIRCEVTRHLDPTMRTAELTWPLASSPIDRLDFEYPANFTPSLGSTPEADERCHMAWHVREQPDGEGLFAAKGEFGFGLGHLAHWGRN